MHALNLFQWCGGEEFNCHQEEDLVHEMHCPRRPQPDSDETDSDSDTSTPGLSAYLPAVPGDPPSPWLNNTIIIQFICHPAYLGQVLLVECLKA